MTEAPHADPPGDLPGGSPAPPTLDQWLAGHPGATRLLPADVAELAGIQVASFNHLNSRSKARRRSPRTYGAPRPGDIPAARGKTRARRGPPVDYWQPEQIRPWLEARADQAAELIPSLTGEPPA